MRDFSRRVRLIYKIYPIRSEERANKPIIARERTGGTFPTGCCVSSFRSVVAPSRGKDASFSQTLVREGLKFLYSCFVLFKLRVYLAENFEKIEKQHSGPTMKRIEEDDGFVLRCSKKVVRRAFADVISHAKKRNELVCGVYEAAELLRWGGAAKVQFCILVKSDDPANQVFCRLIEAYCCENRIKVIKVDCGLTLTLLTGGTTNEIHHCVLVQKPTELIEETCLAQQTLVHYMKYTETRSVLKIS